MICDLCSNNCYKCSSGPFKGLRLKFDYLSKISLKRQIKEIQDLSTRHSISGVQPKMLADINRGKLKFNEAGRYILKPAPNAQFRLLADTPANEHLSMRIASNIYDIETATNGLIQIDNELVYITKRFDINHDNTRKLQEDFAQLLNRSQATYGQDFKYDYSYEQFNEIVNSHFAAPAITKSRLFDLIVFNYIIGNGDAHLKNFSGYQSTLGDMILSPAYDLLSTFIHTPEEKITALDIFKDYETPFYIANGYPGQESFRELGERLGALNVAAILQKYQDEINLNASLAMIDKSLLSNEAKTIYSKLIQDRVKVISR